LILWILLKYLILKYCTHTREAMYIQRNIQALSQDHFYRGKAISIKCFECVSVALAFRHTKHICHIILSSVALPHFSTYLIKGTIFGKTYYYYHYFFGGVGGLRLNACLGLLIIEVSRSHITTYHRRQNSSVRVISSLQRPT